MPEMKQKQPVLEDLPERAKRVTRNDVAKLANVSPAVVSYVINNSKFVSDEKKEAVLQAIKDLNYKPNLQARGLKTNKSMQIAFVCDNLMNYWLEDTESILFEKGYYVSHCYSRDSDDFIQRLIARQFDAIYMMTNRFSTAQLNEIAAADIPIVLFKTRAYGELDPRIATIVPDYRDGVIKSVNYLAMKGHKRIALLPPLRYRTTGIYDDGFRIKAYIQAMEANGLEVREELICTTTDSFDTISNSAVNMLLAGDLDARPTAFVACNDFIAINVMKQIRQLGLKIPQDVAIIGTDNTYMSELVSPALTTVDFNKEVFASKLANALLSLIDGKRPQDEFIPVSVVIREST